MKRLESLASTEKDAKSQDNVAKVVTKAKSELEEAKLKLARKQMEANDVKAKVAEDEKIAEKSSDKIKKKKEDEKELEEIEDAALGKKKSNRSKRYKPPHVVEGENGKEYIKHTEAVQKELYEEHKAIADEEEKDRMDKLEKERKAKFSKTEKSPEAQHRVDERQKPRFEEQSGSESESESDSGSDDEQAKDEDEDKAHAQQSSASKKDVTSKAGLKSNTNIKVKVKETESHKKTKKVTKASDDDKKE